MGDVRMMIWKTPIGYGYSHVALPQGAQPLSVNTQDGMPMMWSRVDPKAEMEEKHLYVAGTGEELPWGLGEFVGTFLLDEGRLVFHVFEVAP